jgi:diguanylate cyclase (GGDEF)-like protein/PAS domain S-box-containing protein
MIEVPNNHRVAGRAGKEARGARHPVLEAIPDAVVVTDPDGVIVFVNRAAEALSGYKRSDLVGKKVEVLVPARMRGIHVRHRRNFYSRGAPRLMGDSSGDFEMLRKDGSTVPVEISLGPVGADTVAVIRDETERHRMEAALEHRALHDPLTDLANRTLFFDRLHQSIHAARREGHHFALVMLDVDGFKAINDKHGHGAGDVVLKEVGRRLVEGLRATDTAARIGGDEFAWILPQVASREEARRTVRKRVAGLEEPIELDGMTMDPTISAGVALYPDDGADADTLMREADAAMYAIKRRHHADEGLTSR